MPSEIYNALKLSEYRPLFQDKRVLVIGAGAVGSYLMEFLAKMGVSPDALDFDTLPWKTPLSTAAWSAPRRTPAGTRPGASRSGCSPFWMRGVPPMESRGMCATWARRLLRTTMW